MSPDDVPGAAPGAELVEQPVMAGTPAWHALRRTGIGGSDVAAMLGLSPWKSPYELYLEKRGEMAPTEANEAMRLGTIFEPVIRQLYVERTGVRVIVPHEMFRSQAFPFMLANLDGLTEHGRILEIKNARSGAPWGDPELEEIPVPYRLQVEHYFATTGYELADVAVLIAGSELRIYTIRADLELQTMIVEAAAGFWRRVERGEPPPVLTLDDARMRFGHVALQNAKALVATAEQLDAHAKLCAMLAEQRTLEAQADALKAQLMAAMGDVSDTLIDAAGKTLATYRMPKAPMRLDTDGLAAAHPEIVAQFTKTGKASRRLLVKDIAP